MKSNANISDELLNAFVDNELETNEKSEILDVIGRDDALKGRVCELRGLKEMVKHAYHHPPMHEAAAENVMRLRRPQYVQNIRRIAACVLLLLLGGVSGWFIATKSESRNHSYVAYVSRAAHNINSATGQGNIIFQVSTSNPLRLKAVLDEAESLLEASRHENRQLNVEIMANAEGVDLLRADVSPYGKRIGLMQAKYPNLGFLACGQAIRTLRSSGIAVHLLPNTGVASSAAEEINKRLQQGWDYARI
ncbi:anti-sigma factor [Sideroxydans lithotrophicus]|uniref:Putative transmembrane anti-sigma factor n=1 Tax=Sideroxydans lithotrophicus (strain ES-1) TaxID=580332 RepID=D5CSJ8_SIDLE|nr:anti-sigma factor [Sideroxydans lithotrophicus]ADE11934.1 putative transmembrane anti-sigma factor [Sideroxydans lithotrophicus ES-1]